MLKKSVLPNCFNLKRLLDESPMGKAIMSLYNERRSMDSKCQGYLVEIIVLHFLSGNFNRLTNESLSEIANQIVKLFPNEVKDTYFTSPVRKRDSHDGKAGIAKGKLIDKYRNKLAFLRKAKILPSRCTLADNEVDLEEEAANCRGLSFEKSSRYQLRSSDPIVGHKSILPSNIQQQSERVRSTPKLDANTVQICDDILDCVSTVSNDTTTSEALSSQPKSGITNDFITFELEDLTEPLHRNIKNFNLKRLLIDSPMGKAIISLYNERQSLDSKCQGYLVEIIILHFLSGNFNRLTNESLSEISDKIIQLFPNEMKEAYFTSPVRKRDSCDGRAGIARGKLVDKYRNKLAFLRKAKILPTRFNLIELEVEDLKDKEKAVSCTDILSLPTSPDYQIQSFVSEVGHQSMIPNNIEQHLERVYDVIPDCTSTVSNDTMCTTAPEAVLLQPISEISNDLITSELSEPLHKKLKKTVSDHFNLKSDHFNLPRLLNESPMGKAIVSLYNKHKSLDSKCQGYLVEMIVLHFLNGNFNRLTNESLSEIADQIIKLFPNELKDTYFSPPVRKRDSQVGKAGVARGKLVDKYRNKLTFLRKAKILSARSSVTENEFADLEDKAMNNSGLPSCPASPDYQMCSLVGHQAMQQHLERVQSMQEDDASTIQICNDIRDCVTTVYSGSDIRDCVTTVYSGSDIRDCVTTVYSGSDIRDCVTTVYSGSDTLYTTTSEAVSSQPESATSNDFVTSEFEEMTVPRQIKLKKSVLSDHFSLELLLNESPMGKAIMSLYNEHQSLDSTCQGYLVEMIILNFLSGNFNRLTNESISEIADQIIQLFPNEKRETYFTSPVRKRDSHDGKAGIAKGKLVDKYRNKLAFLRKAKILPGRFTLMEHEDESLEYTENAALDYQIQPLLPVDGHHAVLQSKTQQHMEKVYDYKQNCRNTVCNDSLCTTISEGISSPPESVISNDFVTSDYEEQTDSLHARNNKSVLSDYFNLKRLLIESPMGKAIVSLYNERQSLDSKCQGYLVEMIVLHFLNGNFNRLTNQNLSEIADQIIHLFPNEVKETYFTSPVRKRYSQLGKAGVARGKLYDKYKNKLTFLRKAKILPSRFTLTEHKGDKSDKRNQVGIHGVPEIPDYPELEGISIKQEHMTNYSCSELYPTASWDNIPKLDCVKKELDVDECSEIKKEPVYSSTDWDTYEDL